LYSWVAKEALYKAVYPAFKPTWKDVSIVKAKEGLKPTLVFEEAGQLGGKRLNAHMSVSHDGEYLVVGVVVERSA
jgi:holo-[acyl-carrier protein] synthase